MAVGAAAAAIAGRPELVVVGPAIVRRGVSWGIARAAVVRVGVVVGRVARVVPRGLKGGLHRVHVVDDVGAAHGLPDQPHDHARRQIGRHRHCLLWNVAHHVVDSFHGQDMLDPRHVGHSLQRSPHRHILKE